MRRYFVPLEVYFSGRRCVGKSCNLLSINAFKVHGVDSEFCNRKAHAAGLCTGVEGGGARDMDAGHRPGAVKPLGLRGILQVPHDTAAAACGGGARSSTTSSEARRINPKRQVLKRPRVTAC